MTLPFPEEAPVVEKKEKKEGEPEEIVEAFDEKKYTLYYKLIDNDNGSYTVKYKCETECD